MARGGINKALVKDARDTVLLRGDNPSIDAIRIELGNTGSKTTIHRYLKELEEIEGTRLDDTVLLSDTLKQMIAKLANQLQLEARHIVEQSSELHKTQSDNLQNKIGELKLHITSLTEQLESKTNTLNSTESELLNINKQRQKESTKYIELAEKLSSLEIRITDKSNHIQSLEDKHQHARDALEHFRQTAKDQREQEILRHEQQIQHIQAEQRQLNQTLSVKQDELTHLNKDNVRLVTQLNEAQKQRVVLLTKNKEQEVELKKQVQSKTKIERENESLCQKISLLEVAVNQQVTDSKQIEITNEKLIQELNQLKQNNHKSELELAKLKAEVHTQEAIFSQLKASKVELV